MYCPKCGQERLSDQSRFCSRCGYLLTSTAELLLTGGIPPYEQKPVNRGRSRRKRGVMQGLFIFLLTFLFVPLVAIISKGLDLSPVFVAITAITLFIGGLLRMAYAVMFESADPAPAYADQAPFAVNVLRHGEHAGALPPQQTYPASDYVSPTPGRWRDTNELQPGSVTEGTTKLLQNEADDQ